MLAREPRNEDLFKIMQDGDPAAATLAFEKFLTTTGEWWRGDTPLAWARRTAEQAVVQFARNNWPVHKLDGSSWIANLALVRLAQLAPKVKSPPAFLYGYIHNTIRWTLVGRHRDGEPWAEEPEDVLGTKAAPPSSGASLKLWSDPEFYERVGRAINGLTETLRPYAILHLLDAMRPVDIATALSVPPAKARQYCIRAQQAMLGRKDVHALKKLPDTRAIREALEMAPELAAPQEAKQSHASAAGEGGEES